MTKKLIIILIGIIWLLIAVVIISAFVKRDVDDGQYTQLPDNDGLYTESTRPSDTSGPTILQKGGGYTQVRDFMSDEDTYEFTPTTVVLGKAEGLQGSEYEIFYFPEDGSVTISLLSEPLHTIRLLAEEELLISLGVGEYELCNFDVWVSAPGDVSEIYSGRNLGLSFCEGSITLK